MIPSCTDSHSQRFGRTRALTVAFYVLAASWLVSRAEPSAASAGARPDQRLRRVIIVFKTHFDIGYTDLATNIVQRYRTTMIDQALQVVDRNRDLPPRQQFAWTIPGWPMKKITEDWDGQKVERQQRIMQAFKDGRFVVHALPFTTHTELLEIEDLVRGMTFATDLSRRAGLALPRDAKMTDVPCHAWIIPTLLRNAGVDFLHLGCNAASSSPQVPALFWWEGPDGSRLLTMYSAAGYGTGLIPPADWPYATWLALYHTGDNHGPPTPDEVKTLLAEAAQELPGVDVRIGRLSDFADAILAEKAGIPVIRGDMPDTWIHGPMCDPAGAKLARHIRPAIANTESLGTLLQTWGVPAPDVTGAIARAYEQSLLYGEHTWGGALYWITQYAAGQIKFGYGETFQNDMAAGRFKRLEESWAEHTRYIETAEKLISPWQQSQMQLLADSIGGTDGLRVVVYNPLPYKRNGIVTLPLPAGVSSLAPVRGGSAVRVSVRDGVAEFIARDIPAQGYRTFVPVKRPVHRAALRADAPSATLENRWFKAVLDPGRCAIRSLVDKRSGRELVDTAAPQGFGQYLYERFDADQVAAYVKAYVKIDADWARNELGKPPMPSTEQVPYRAATPINGNIRVEQSPVRVMASMRAERTSQLGHPVTTRVILYADQPYLDLEVTIHDKPADPWPEAGWICLPFRVDSPQFRIGRQGSIINPANDIVPGANRNLMAVNTGIAVFDAAGRGAGLCPVDSPLISLDSPGCWKYSPHFVPKTSRIYVNLFNNQWTTNFRLWNSGSWTSRVRIWAFDRFTPEAALITPSLEARNPLLAATATGNPGPLPASRTGIELSRPSIALTAFGPNPDGAGRVLRLWEQAGLAGPCQVRLPAGMDAAFIQPVSLRGEPAGAVIPIKHGSFSVWLGRFAPASFVLPKAP